MMQDYYASYGFMINVILAYLKSQLLKETRFSEKIIIQLMQLAFLLKEKDRGEQLLTLSIELCRKSAISCIVSGIQLMTSLSQLMGSIMAEQFISMQLFSQLESDSVEIKCMCAKCIAIITEYVSKKFAEERMLPIFKSYIVN